MESTRALLHLSLNILSATLARVVEWRGGLVFFIVELYSVV